MGEFVDSTDNVKIFFRTDASIAIGSGHVMRCLTLADELRVRKCEVAFICRDLPGNLILLIEEKGYLVYKLPDLSDTKVFDWQEDAARTANYIQASIGYADWVVVDHYELDIFWESALRKCTQKIMVIDDLANRPHDCNLLLDQNYFNESTESRYLNRVSDNCETLLGPRYALLQPEYSTLHKILPQHDGLVSRVLVFFGGSDLSEQTKKVLIALDCLELAFLVVDVVIGKNYADIEGIEVLVAKRPGTSLYRSLPSLAALMMRADFVIGAGGVTTWERMCLGLPSLVISLADNQYEFTQALSERNFQMSLTSGKLTSSADWQQAISEIINKPTIIKQLSQNAQSLVDGLGVKRVVRAILRNEKFNLTIRKANTADEAILFDWINDLEVRKQSFQQEYIDRSEHSQWFATKLVDPECVLLIGEDEAGLPIGQVRFEMNAKMAEAIVDISIDNSLRGMGFSEQLLGEAIKYWRKLNSTFKLKAEIRDENIRSQQLFIKLNFIFTIRSMRVGAKTFELIF
ncbi:MAG: UDP-2,4-diacetamido-2,4,6-trideoxy-beta-L-altropyranose hydrolase [Verrucomicrobia bacterium RIFCSPHIGHO2_12_FULL_41_10]|nr:MAG: UDP-2,4-diacetamido-2,4,6-trideoxy-beta-L-altropyranose hydrolase [Verrucomicrobia bacterium RIFCSPHIGHO2_12_FULL_41_10]